MKYRLAVLTSHVIQYQDPLFRQLAAHPEVDLTVLFCSREGAESYHDSDLGVNLRWDLEMLAGYHHRFLRNVSPKTGVGFWTRINPGVALAIARGDYDAVLVMGWGSITSWLAFATCAALRIPFYLNGDSSFVEKSQGVTASVRTGLLRLLFRRTSAFLLMGTMNGDFYRHFGADPTRFHLMPYAIDNDRFRDNSRLISSERDSLLQELGIAHNSVVILFSGKLIARKNPAHVVRALEKMRHRNRTTVVFMGDGAERGPLEAYVKERNIPNVRFLGFVNQSRMPRMYALADVLVLPSARDHRGTVVNEAMACGLPIVITDQVGVWGEGDIVRNCDNGFVFSAGDIDRLAELLDTLVNDEALRSRMGARSLEIISAWDYESDIDGILSALRATVFRPSSTSRFDIASA